MFNKVSPSLTSKPTRHFIKHGAVEKISFLMSNVLKTFFFPFVCEF